MEIHFPYLLQWVMIYSFGIDLNSINEQIIQTSWYKKLWVHYLFVNEASFLNLFN